MEKKNFIAPKMSNGRGNDKANGVKVVVGMDMKVVLTDEGKLEKGIGWDTRSAQTTAGRRFSWDFFICDGGQEITFTEIINSRGTLGLTGKTNDELIEDFCLKYDPAKGFKAVGLVETKSGTVNIYAFNE